ncbi:phosphate ABC transporter permease subunit PstC [Niveibacterium sp.]|uniref:phosphate ABC transporter permease subunit PstC n=1 Tax=Niveibacterium sp. TaxID=2017444 RepID=UPI0035AFF750
MTSIRHAPEHLLARHFRQRIADGAFLLVTRAAAALTLLVLLGIILSLIVGASESIQKFGFGFLVSREWNPPKEQFGALVPIYGTIVTSLIALAIAVPVSFGIAVFLTELSPVWMRRPLGIAIELLAAIPSIVYGMWGLMVFAPFFAQYIQPSLSAVFGPIPLFGRLFQGAPLGVGILAAGVILAIMIIPFIAAVMRDVFSVTPVLLKESAYGLGCTTWEVVSRIVLPHTRIGVFGGIMLGLGRALGETMAVTFVIGNTNFLSGLSLYAPGTSITSTLANEFGEATPGIYTSALIELGLILFAITFAVLVCSRLLLLRLAPRDAA